MEKQIILEINRLNELMNLSLIIEGVGDGIKKLVTIIKDALRIAESEKTLLKNYVKGVQLTEEEIKSLVTALKKDDTIITTLEAQINTPGKLTANELTEATAKLNDLKSLKNTIHPAEDLLVIKKWFHLTEEGQSLYGEFKPFVSQKTLDTLEANKSKFFDGTVDYLDPKRRLELVNACQKIETTIETVLSKVTLPPNKREVLEESSGWLKKARQEIVNNPETAAKKVKGYRKLAWQILLTIIGVIAVIGVYNSGCKSDFVGGVMRIFGFCKGGGIYLNNGGGSNNGGGGTHI
jgi:hypothetical protein